MSLSPHLLSPHLDFPDYSGEVSSMDCKQRSLAVRTKSSIVSKKAPPLFCACLEDLARDLPQGLTWACSTNQKVLKPRPSKPHPCNMPRSGSSRRPDFGPIRGDFQRRVFAQPKGPHCRLIQMKFVMLSSTLQVYV